MLFLLIINLLASTLLRAQDGDTVYKIANKIAIMGSGIHALTKNATDKIAVDAETNTVLYPYPDDVKSYWYKIYITVDCNITFEIYPSELKDRYNYFMYQKKGDLTINEVYTTNIIPVRANLYSGKMEAGTGLSPTSTVSSNDSCPRNIEKVFYHTPYHAPIIAKAGDILLLNVYHLNGTDCGHHFKLKTGTHSQEFYSIDESCYKEKAVVQKPGHVLQNMEMFEPSKAIFSVKDSTRQSKIDASATCIKQCREINSISNAEIKGTYETPLEKNTEYQVIFSAFGYRSKTVSFTTHDTLQSIKQEILLSLLKEGEDFIMDKIYFYPNTYSMRPGSISQINQLAAHLNANPGIKIEIQGHTNGNKRIKKNYNLKTDSMLVTEGRFKGSAKQLSQYRADLIKKQLIEKGVSSDRLVATGYGGNKMIHPNPKDQQEADKNIRVGVMIISQKENAFPISTMVK